MQKQQEQREKRKAEDEKQRAISESHWVIRYKNEKSDNKTSAPTVIYESSLLKFESTATFGRQSFQQFNPEWDELRRKTAEKRQQEEMEQQRQRENDQEMAGWYRKYGKTGTKRARESSEPTSSVPRKRSASEKDDSASSVNGTSERSDGFLRPTYAVEDEED
jgi:hypothetical protein